MKEKKNKKTLKSSPSLKKSLGELMKDEDGFVSKENILKVGLSTVAALGIVGSLAENSQAVHTNSTNLDTSGTCVYHTNHESHSNY
ncbi:MAG: hypothetical protein IT395_07535 [Candidatus Omnitrophica bacterium]|nr:hypothetical protein [Candidatus Omnitrophota bacterium]